MFAVTFGLFSFYYRASNEAVCDCAEDVIFSTLVLERNTHNKQNKTVQNKIFFFSNCVWDFIFVCSILYRVKMYAAKNVAKVSVRWKRVN